MKRTADTMSDAISISSPSGEVSKRSRRLVQERLRVALFGENGLQQSKRPQPTEVESWLRQAAELRELANRGLSPKRYLARAIMLEEKANKA